MDTDTHEFLAALEREHGNTLSNDDLVPPGERECPICKTRMPTVQQHGVHVDVCDAHGVWLDRRELPAMIARIRAGETISRRQATDTANGDDVLAASMLGVWSLLID